MHDFFTHGVEAEPLVCTVGVSLVCPHRLLDFCDSQLSSLCVQDTHRGLFIQQLRPTQNLQARIKLKLFGHSGAGKTTLVESLKCGLLRSFFRRRRPRLSSTNSTRFPPSPLATKPTGRKLRWPLRLPELLPSVPSPVHVWSWMMGSCGPGGCHMLACWPRVPLPSSRSVMTDCSSHSRKGASVKSQSGHMSPHPSEATSIPLPRGRSPVSASR